MSTDSAPERAPLGAHTQATPAAFDTDFRYALGISNNPTTLASINTKFVIGKSGLAITQVFRCLEAKP
jgi:hypothetical protein